VLLVMDSATRYARALRDVALSAGEPPARRGFPASVFEALPRLVERPGNAQSGSITAFYTVLLEDDADPDPVGEEVKSLLDGHVYLSPRLAQRGHFPAIDVLRSASRLYPQLASERQAAAATRVRAVMGRLDDLQLLRDIGEYRPGAQPEQDDAVAREPRLLAFLRQPLHEPVTFDAAVEALDALAR
jgi:type III secretion protein N (ATPase)